MAIARNMLEVRKQIDFQIGKNWNLPVSKNETSEIDVDSEQMEG